jgi:diadenosine tetraphosphate (Ap4A) HIT family hydrolase
MTDFALHDRLAADTAFIHDLPLCRVLLIKNCLWPWLVLVPRKPDLREFYDLSKADQAILMDEIATTAQKLSNQTKAHKMNIGALGNIVPQLHIHIIARTAEDPAWPGPVWGSGHAEAYPDDELQDAIKLYRSLLL